MLHVLGVEEIEIANFNYETGNIIRESTEPTEMKFVQYTYNYKFGKCIIWNLPKNLKSFSKFK